MADRPFTPPYSFPECDGRYTIGGKINPPPRQTFFVKACGSRKNFSNMTFNSLLHCYCIAFDINANKTELRRST